MGIIQYARKKLNDYVRDNLGLVGEVLATPVKHLPKVASGIALLYAATTTGCAAIPMYDFGAEREQFRLENKAKEGRLTLCGRAEMRGATGDGVDIESIVARGIAEVDLGAGFHAVGNHIAKPNGDITLLGIGYRGKIGDNNVYHVQVKVPIGDEGSTEVEGFILHNGDKAVLYIRGRYYPETDNYHVEAAARTPGKVAPVIEVQLTPDEAKALAGLRINF